MRGIIASARYNSSGGSAPVNLTAPVVSGAASVGDTATTTNGTWTNSPTSYAYQWQELIASVWTDISGETANTYLTDHAGTFRCEVTASNAHGPSTAPANSNSVTVTSGSALIWGRDNIVNGGGPNSTDRMWVAKYVKSNSGAITTIHANFVNPHGVGNTAKVVAMADNAGVPGSVLWVSGATAIPAGTSSLTFSLPGDVSGTTPAGTYWLGVVSSDYQGYTASDVASGITTALISVFNFASPPATCPAPATTYSDQGVGVWCDYIG